MQFGLISVLALATSITGVVSAPVAVEKRAAFNPSVFANQLLSSVAPQISSLEKTIEGVAANPGADVNAALTTVTSEVSSVEATLSSAAGSIPAVANGAIDTVTGEASSIVGTADSVLGMATGAAGSIEGLANVGSLSQTVGSLIAKISGVSDQAVKVFGLSTATSTLAPLTSEINGLVGSLESVAPGLTSELTSVVGSLVPGGLSAGLPNLNL